MSIYVNRVLNMKHIKAIGFDMDHTLVRYYSDKFEELTFNASIKKLIEDKAYPQELSQFKFNFDRAVRGLVADKANGNLLKVSLYNKIKNTYHGTRELTYKEQQKLYRGSSVDLKDDMFVSIDTAFSIAFCIIFSQIVDLKNARSDLALPSYSEIADDVLWAVDKAHMDGSLKDVVKQNLDQYIIKDPKAVAVLERFKSYGKKLWIITNSDYNYTKALLDYSINPFLKEYKHWSELFEVVITLSQKPRFFNEEDRFLKVHTDSGMLQNYHGPVLNGIYQGGNAIKLQKDHGLSGDEILYLGDHIYGDIVKLKKSCEWRTALVIEEIDQEVVAYKQTKNIGIEIESLMEEKVGLEREIDQLYAQEFELKMAVDKKEVNAKFQAIENIDKKLATLIKSYEKFFNPYWGEILRAGVEPSFYASQIERYACIYMGQIGDFADYGPRTYFRPKKRKMAHEL